MFNVTTPLESLNSSTYTMLTGQAFCAPHFYRIGKDFHDCTPRELLSEQAHTPAVVVADSFSSGGLGEGP